MFSLWKRSAILALVQLAAVLTGAAFGSVWTGATIALLLPLAFLGGSILVRLEHPTPLDLGYGASLVASMGVFLLWAVWALAAPWAFVLAFLGLAFMFGGSTRAAAHEAVEKEHARAVFNGEDVPAYAPWMVWTALPLGISVVVGGPLLLWHRLVRRRVSEAESS